MTGVLSHRPYGGLEAWWAVDLGKMDGVFLVRGKSTASRTLPRLASGNQSEGDIQVGFGIILVSGSPVSRIVRINRPADLAMSFLGAKTSYTNAIPDTPDISMMISTHASR